MRFIRYVFLAALAVCLVTIALANAQMVSLKLLPEALAQATGYSWAIELPLFVVVFIGILAGLLMGFVWEWMREHKHRAEAARRRGEVKKLENELKRVKGATAETAKTGDEVLALLEKAG
ncbi:LapA family protein [Lentibacter sp. XHP0401]|jgi:lipopolysaccharide assembly protein A|uniref:LapA family protein n=1 Tax=Lentibacter sp. XHP0401 TaxID=2984334 RepID=UPI0021E85D4E|nr:LapA family protein [Lentibacter sp. XHP0401]MCV2894533.1 LapA family protein [Lentibacter sp. XHP0401]